MLLRFTKSKHGDDLHTLTCVRDDGTVTFTHESRYIVFHDLVHYALEETLNWPEAFFGLVAGGRDMEDFGTKNGVKDTYTEQALWAEEIVGAVQWVVFNVFSSLAEAWETLCQSHAAQGRRVPDAALAHLETIHARAVELHIAFDRLAPGEILELSLYPPAAA